MRGKAKAVALDKDLSRITPAYAGKSYFCGSWYDEEWDHPRLCGEKGEKVGDAIGGAGSPPPMRGKVFRFGVEGAKCGITPAYAGKS